MFVGRASLSFEMAWVSVPGMDGQEELFLWKEGGMVLQGDVSDSSVQVQGAGSSHGGDLGS
jgi:hypothetical protein